MGFTLENTENLEEQDSLGKYTLEDEVYKPPKTSKQKGAEAILSAIGPGADVAKGLVRGVGQFGGSVVDLFSQLGTLAEQSPLAKAMRRRPEELDYAELGKSYGKEALTEKLASLGVHEPETVLGRTAQRLGSYGPFALGAGFVPSLISAGAGQLAEELGAGEGLQTAAEIGAPFAKTIGQAVSKVPGAIKTFFKTKPATYASGLEKPLVSEAPEFLKKVSKVVPEQKEEAINFLGSQAEPILEKIKNKLPQYSKYAEGFDFKGYHDEIFKDVKSIAKNFKGTIDTEPLLRFLSKQKKELKRIPNPTQGQKKSLKQIIQYQNSQRAKYTPSQLAIAKTYGQKLPIYKGKDKLDTLLNVYRNLNVELSEILEKKFSGKLPQYKKFIGDYKDEITKLFDSQLGPRNDFNKLFKTSNKSYEDYNKILELEELLQPSIGQKLLPNDWIRLAKNKEFPKLEKAVGKSMASEIQGLANDIVDAQKNISNLKNSKALTDLIKAGPAVAAGLATYIYPGLAPLITGTIGLDVGRRAIGYILLKPSRIQAYKNAINALKNGDVKSYKNYLGPIIRAVGGEEKEED